MQPPSWRVKGLLASLGLAKADAGLSATFFPSGPLVLPVWTFGGGAVSAHWPNPSPPLPGAASGALPRAAVATGRDSWTSGWGRLRMNIMQSQGSEQIVKIITKDIMV